MPELPETETIARDLDRTVSGAVVAAIMVKHSDVLRGVTPARLRARVVGATLGRTWRRAKHIVIDLSTTDHLVVQPRFTGALLIDTGDLPDGERQYSTVAFELTDGRTLHYRDIRRLGTVTLMTASAFAKYADSLGPEPLEPSFTPAALRAILARSRQPVKKALMDQRLIAGIGNIYATESLWRAGIDPSRPAARVSQEASERLHREIVDVLRRSIRARGTSFRDYRDARGMRGSFAAELLAYGRAGEACGRCGRRLVGTAAIDGRMTVFCSHCQR